MTTELMVMPTARRTATLDDLLATTLLEARQYQKRIVRKAVRMFEGTHTNGAGNREPAARSVMIESPTGSGKTDMALLVARLMQERHGALVAWHAMRRNLLGQAAAENETPSEGNKRGKSINADVNFLSTFAKELPEELLPENRDGRPLLLVGDEAHHDAADSSIHIHNVLQPDWTLGITATPFRTDSAKLYFEKTIKDCGIHRLIQDGYLSPYDHYTITDWQPETVADFIAMNPQEWAPGLVFFHQHHQSKRFYRRLTEHHGIPCQVVTGSTNREEQLRMLASGELMFLANCAVLTEGLDFPGLRSVFVRDSGRGCTIQMGGRVFRKYAGITTKRVVQSKNTRWPFIKTALPKSQHVWENGLWLTLDINPRMEDMAQNARIMIANTATHMPQFIQQQRVKKRARRF